MDNKIKVSFSVTRVLNNYNFILTYKSPINDEIFSELYAQKHNVTPLDFIKEYHRKMKNIKWVRAQIINSLSKRNEIYKDNIEIEKLINEINDYTVEIDLDFKKEFKKL